MLLRVSGSSFHQDTLQMLGGGAHPTEPKHPLVMATLRVETTGEYAGAVRVFIGDREVGSIPKDSADAYRAVVEEVEATTGPATCRGQVIGGGLSHEGDFWLSFGFELLQPTKPRIRAADDPFLPPTGFFQVLLDEGQEQRLDEMLHSKAKSKNLDIPVHLSFGLPACRSKWPAWRWERWSAKHGSLHRSRKQWPRAFRRPPARGSPGNRAGQRL